MFRQTYSFTSQDITLNCDHYYNDQPCNAMILYFHGGGLFYGTRDDLAITYIEKMVNAGYQFLCFDYPLAPEVNLKYIHESIFDCFSWYIHHDHFIKKYFLFGRSAGAYLSLYLSNVIIQQELIQPLGIISFYGYYNLHEVSFNEPSKFYNKLPKVSLSTFAALSNKDIITYGEKSKRFALYIFARQQGNWMQLLTMDHQEKSAFSLDDEALSKFPPTFITASSTDQDVPFAVSKSLKKRIPQSYFKPVYNLEHDFDRDDQLIDNQNLYQEVIEWMDSLR